MKRVTLALMLVAVSAMGLPAFSAPPANVYESNSIAKPNGEFDRIVFKKLTSLNIKPVLCSDAVFVRRAFLDTIGRIPTAEEARDFITDSKIRTKRQTLIRKLLERPEFADYWAMKWGDTLRIKAEFPVNLWPNAAQAYYRFIHASIAQDKPYNDFVREMITASGSNFRVGQVNFYRAVQNKTPEGLATAVALAFMGARTEKWPKERLDGMAVFFSQVGYKPTSEWKEEVVFWDPLGTAAVAGNAAPGQAKIVASVMTVPFATEKPLLPTANTALHAVFPDGTKVTIPPDKDPRAVFADWLISPQNPWFAKSISNRVCGWLLGRGIIHEPDDIRDDNPPSNPELLAYLEKEFTTNGCSIKHLFEVVLTSTTYQFSSIPRSNSPEAVANFANYPLRRLEAEVLIDAINTITGTSDLYTSAIPEPFTYIPKEFPAVAISDGSITSRFLALFGRSPRATGMENERNNDTDSAQWLHMLNSGHIQQKLQDSPNLKALYKAKAPPERILEELYLMVLSRPPTRVEMEKVFSYGKDDDSLKRYRALDLAWAMINTTEFLYRH